MSKNRYTKRFFQIKAIIFFVLFSWNISAAEALFLQDLSLGSESSAVKELQVLLNKDTLTRLQSFGPGSPGQETAYFGPLTKNAVIRFQEKYAAEVLHPIGLVYGTGYVGPKTREKLNSLLKSGLLNNNQTVEPAQNTVKEQPATASKPQIFRVSPESGPIGTEVVLYGTGFDKTDNTIYASFRKFENIASPDGKTIKFKVDLPFPKEFLDDLPDDRAKLIPDFNYEFLVKTDYGLSNPVDFILENNF